MWQAATVLDQPRSRVRKPQGRGFCSCDSAEAEGKVRPSDLENKRRVAGGVRVVGKDTWVTGIKGALNVGSPGYSMHLMNH